MNSSELNAKIGEIADKGDELGFDAFDEMESGKAIPYIGWFWREVDFDAETFGFGLLPTRQSELAESMTGDGEVNVKLYKVGFMENNKWGYADIEATKEESSSIRALLVAAAENPTKETLSAANDAIQAIRFNWTLTKETRSIGGESFGEYNAERKH